MKKLFLLSLLSCPLLAAAQPASPAPPMPPLPPAPPAPPAAPFHEPMLGIPPHVAKKLGIPEETVRKIKDMGFEANEQFIGLEADLKRAQLQLDRQLSAPTPDEAAVMQRLDAVGKAELAVRKNRVGLMLRIRKLLGPEAWEKLQAESPRVDHQPRWGDVGPGPGAVRREVRVFVDKQGPGPDEVEIEHR